MKHTIKEFDVYYFEELNEDIQEKVIERERKNPYHLDYEWHIGVLEDFAYKAKFIGIDKANFDFSGDPYGDDAKLCKGEININKVIKGVKFKHYTKKIFLDYLEYGIDKYGNAYFEWFYDYNNSYRHLNEYFNKIAEKLEKEINKKIIILNNELRDNLTREYIYLTSDTYIKEEIMDSEMLFYEDGRLYQE